MNLLIAFLFPMAAGVCVSVWPGLGGKMRRWLYAAVVLITDLLSISAMVSGGSGTLFKISDQVSALFRLDDVGRFALAAVLILYTAVTFYAFSYMEKEERENVFFAFLFVSFGAMIAVCMSSNLMTLYFSFELATLSSVPLVLHEMTKEAVAAGMKYLFYSIAGALLGLLAVFFVYYYSAGSAEFVYGGFLDPEKIAGHEGVLLAAVFAGIIGFGTKAGMYPMHGWLPTAHPIAPAPASSLLSGIIAKAGVVAVIRLVYYCVGASFLRGTWVQTAWMCLAMLTVFMGSMMAFQEKVIKKRLAYSTISQVSYVMVALSCLSDEGLRGGLLQMMAHMSAKGCLFLAAGVFISALGFHEIHELKGVGKRLPVTMWCFMIAALSLVGIPPMGGFTSKWKIAAAALSNGRGILSVLPPVVLLISALLTAGYLFPVVIDAFFPGRAHHDEDQKADDGAAAAASLNGQPAPDPIYEGMDVIPACDDRSKPDLLMNAPMIALCAAALAVGVFGAQIVGRMTL